MTPFARRDVLPVAVPAIYNESAGEQRAGLANVIDLAFEREKRAA